MNFLKRTGFQIFFVFILFSGCETENKKVNETEAFITEIRGEYAPDRRVAIFDVKSHEKDGKYVLKGESNLSDAVSSLKQKLTAENITYIDSIQILPSEELSETRGIIKLSVANLRGKPSHSAELVTQATLGTPVNILKREDSWYLIQTPDGYLAWVDNGGIQPVSEQDFSIWKESSKLIFLEPFGFSYREKDTESEVVSDLVAGNILELESEENDFYAIKYPNGRKAFVEKEKSQPYSEWIAAVELSEENLVRTSKSFLGLPYLWGGTSPKGVDCSGFTKTIYFLNGVVLPRDASQQIHAGKLVDSTRNFENLIPGDLLYFGKPATNSTPEKVVHVGMWIGENKFIHAMGDVHISTMDTTAANFDEHNYNRYLRTKRIAGEEDERLIYLNKEDLFFSKEESAEQN